VSESRVFTGYFESWARISFIGLRRSTLTTSPPSFLLIDFRKVLRRMALKFFQENAIAGDLAQRLPVSSA
jgi:hypothetical protein